MSLLDSLEVAAALAVYGGAEISDAERIRASLVEQDVPRRLVNRDPTLWGGSAEAEAAIRLGWVDTFKRSRELLPQLAELKSELADLTHVVLAGMGGSSLAPEVTARTLGRPLTVLDTTDPGQVATALRHRLAETVVVVASKSGSTVETDSHRRAYRQAFIDSGMAENEVGRHFVIVTDAGSPLVDTAREMGAAVVLADDKVGGRYSALTAFGLVPTALAGVDVAELLDQAEELLAALGSGTDNPALALGVALGAAATRDGRDKVTLADDGSGIVGLGDWVEQLLAESTGKDGRGLLPVVIEAPTAPGATGPDVLTVTIGGAMRQGAVPGGGAAPQISVNGPLGAQFLAWEYATAIAGRVLGVNPFDQPNVTESKENTRAILGGGRPGETPRAVDGAVQIFGGTGAGLAGSLRALVDGIAPDGYLAVMAYLDRFSDATMAELRPLLATTGTRRPVTFGWGPRFLHSTGQYHKGGPRVGSYLQITGTVADDLAVPGQPYTFGVLQAAQAAGDRQALRERDRPLLHLHLTHRKAGIAQLLAAARSISGA
jgi:glucose-6-phosphate isomerase